MPKQFADRGIRLASLISKNLSFPDSARGYWAKCKTEQPELYWQQTMCRVMRYLACDDSELMAFLVRSAVGRPLEEVMAGKLSIPEGDVILVWKVAYLFMVSYDPSSF